MSRTHLAPCAHCGIEAALKCAGCIGAPEYQPGDSVAVSYCARDCQGEHWSRHKAYCNGMRQRKKLLRAALILKAALLTYREVLFDIELTNIKFQDGVLYLHQKQRPVTARSIRRPFPENLTTVIEHREAALAINQCTTAMALLGRLTRKLLAGVASTIELLDLHIGRPLAPSRLIPGPDSTSCPHTVLKIGRLFASEAWIFDITGCQYGFREVLVPYNKYIADKECRLFNEPTTYDATETKDLDYFATLPFMIGTRSQQQNIEKERRSRLHFSMFVNENVSQNLLDGSDTDFKSKLNKFGLDLKTHMLDHVK
ncbi:hypothetical protein FQN57_004806 [Myotisia sp. PD_48]|nr:hypothetical protein FQN57_004806 [Myotisia sp. PD_48]